MSNCKQIRSHKKNRSKKGADAEKCKWTDDLRQIFIHSILKYLDKSFADNGFTKVVWTSIVSDFNAKNGMSYVNQQLQSQLNELKKLYQVFKKLKNCSGFGWNEEAKFQQHQILYGINTLLNTKKQKDFVLKRFRSSTTCIKFLMVR